MAQYYTAVDVPQVTFEESDFKNEHSYPQQTLAVFLIVPWLTNWLGLHDALIRSSSLSLLCYLGLHDALVSCLGHFSLLVMFIVPAVVPSRNWWVTFYILHFLYFFFILPFIAADFPSRWYITAVLGIFLPTQTPALRALISKIVGKHEVLNSPLSSGLQLYKTARNCPLDKGT